MASPAARLANAVPTLVPRSRLHRLMSGRYAIIEFTGRTSGRHYSTPIAYVQDGGRVLLSTDSKWWRYLSGGAPVRLRTRGPDVPGTATPLLDPAASLAVIRQLTDAISSYARMARLASRDGQVPDSEIVRQIQEGRVAIEVTLEQSGPTP